MSIEFPGLEDYAHDLAADGETNAAQGFQALKRRYPDAAEDVIRTAMEGHGPTCTHPSKQAEQIRARFDRKRTGARDQVLYTLAQTYGSREDAEATVALIENLGIVVAYDECQPAHHYHAMPHKGCIMR